MNETIFYKVIKKDRQSSTIQMISASLPEHKRTKVNGVKYPAAHNTGSEKDSVLGKLITGLNEKDLKFLDWFEGSEYKRVTVTVHTSDGKSQEAFFYLWTDPLSRLSEEDWDDSWLEDPQAVNHWLDHEIQSLDSAPTF